MTGLSSVLQDVFTHLSQKGIFTEFVSYLGLPWGCLRFVIVVFPDHTHLLFL